MASYLADKTARTVLLLALPVVQPVSLKRAYPHTVQYVFYGKVCVCVFAYEKRHLCCKGLCKYLRLDSDAV